MVRDLPPIQTVGVEPLQQIGCRGLHQAFREGTAQLEFGGGAQLFQAGRIGRAVNADTADEIVELGHDAQFHARARRLRFHRDIVVAAG